MPAWIRDVASKTSKRAAVSCMQEFIATFRDTHAAHARTHAARTDGRTEAHTTNCKYNNDSKTQTSSTVSTAREAWANKRREKHSASSLHLPSPSCKLCHRSVCHSVSRLSFPRQDKSTTSPAADRASRVVHLDARRRRPPLSQLVCAPCRCASRPQAPVDFPHRPRGRCRRAKGREHDAPQGPQGGAG